MTVRFSSDGAFNISGSQCIFMSSLARTWKIQADGKELLVLAGRNDANSFTHRLTISRLTKTSLTITKELQGTIQRESERVN